jgi:hypothetical protein
VSVTVMVYWTSEGSREILSASERSPASGSLDLY